ncbi:MAG TPA: hypothetical protein VII28_12865 [Puia sp.]
MNLRLLGLLLSFPLFMQAQHISYSEPESDDTRRTDHEIIGRVSENILIFKNNRTDNAISIYGPDMKLLQRVALPFLPEKFNNVEFVKYPDFFYLLCEYQKKNIVHLVAYKMDKQAQVIGEPVELDTTQISGSSTNKIYTNLYSEDKQYLMAVKINTKNPKSFIFTTFLFDKNLELLDRHRIIMGIQDHADYFSNFEVDNDGQLVFTRFARLGSGDYLNHVAFVTKGPKADTFAIRDIGAEDRVLDELKLQVDNYNKRYLLSAFYYKQKRGNIEGLFTVIWDKTSDTKYKEVVTVFNDDLRVMAKSSENSEKMAFNDYFIKRIVPKKDGGYLMISEVEYTTTRGSSYNRSDYLYGPMNPADFYSPYYNPYSPYSPYYRYGGGQATRYNAENIMILSFDKNSNMEWSNVIPKSQFDDEGMNQISYQTMNTGGELHFLYNQVDKRTMLLMDQSISADGKITRLPTFHNLDKGYVFLPRLAKQVSSNQIVIPCQYRNYLCFAKIDF